MSRSLDEPGASSVTVATQSGAPCGIAFSTKDAAATPFGQRNRLTGRSASSGSMTGATRA